MLGFLKKMFFFLLIGIIIYLFFTRLYVFKVKGSSMSPTIKNNSFVLIVKWNRLIKRKSVIVFFDPKSTKNKKMIKRVYGIGGDYLIIKKNGYEIKIKPTKKDKSYLKIPKNSYYVVGDNFSFSIDSREGWFVTKDLIVGRALFVFYPIKSFKFLL
jgi:signal peptidase I